MLRTKTNDELFSLYKAELALRIRNQRNLIRYHQVLAQFQHFLSDNNPSSILAKSFLSKWSKQKPATLYKYMSIIKGFLNWYGEELDLKVKLPHQMPEYVEDESIKKLIATIKNKQTHKKAIEQDILLVQLAYNSGLRREELANLKVCDILINEKLLIVRKGKGMKDRTVPLPSGIVRLLQGHITDMNPDNSVFNLKPMAISDKIRRIAKNAGVKIHAHSLRHGYATRLLEKGANIKAVQELLGHSRIGTTEAYLSLLPKHLRETVDLLEIDEKEMKDKETTVLEKSSAKEQLQQQAIVVVKAVCKPSWEDTTEILANEYHSHFVVMNEGRGPAIEIEMALLNNRQEWLDTYRETILRANESLEFRPVLHLPEGRYYMLCQYKYVASQDEDKVWAQTWLPFKVKRASKEGEVYVTPGELEFKLGIPKKDKIELFMNKPK